MYTNPRRAKANVESEKDLYIKDISNDLSSNWRLKLKKFETKAKVQSKIKEDFSSSMSLRLKKSATWPAKYLYPSSIATSMATSSGASSFISVRMVACVQFKLTVVAYKKEKSKSMTTKEIHSFYGTQEMVIVVNGFEGNFSKSIE
jgi:hypothetical protein